ncbi:MAG TPA: sugar phosphate isomerase/epimerase family protein [Methylomirabilota bacterium]|nr:sugar phosphate isomerase/epimerase family protein [Methylomirabilota bacterium]
MNDWPKVDLLASAWTTAGNAKPMTENEESPFDLRSRIEAAAGAGYRGFGIVHADLAAARRQMGLRALRAMLEDSGIVHTEVEMLGDWFATGERRRRSDAIRRDLLEAAQVLGARHIKVGGEIHGYPWPLEKMASDFHDLCRDAANVGSRIAFEIMPFGTIADLTSGVLLVETAGHSAGGLMLDLWHVARGNIDLADVTALPLRYVFAVELDDADRSVVGTMLEDTLDRRRLCGEGALDVPSFIRSIRAAGFDGPWGVEILSDEHRQRSLHDQVTKSYATTIRQFQLANAGH